MTAEKGEVLTPVTVGTGERAAWTPPEMSATDAPSASVTKTAARLSIL
jgi:hypothetical protein